MLKTTIHNLIKKTGYQIIPVQNGAGPSIDNDERFERLYETCKDYTMTSKSRMYALYKSVEYVVKANIPGDFVECGVWRGGNTMLIAHMLNELSSIDRNIYLYDTYEGMVEPTENDRRVTDPSIAAKEKWSKEQDEDHNNWCYASLSEVKSNMATTHYPENRLVFIKGKVEDTIPKTVPSAISILRLDTDWYESTKHELIHMFPLLSKNGVLILDDYGRWAGSKKAVDEYFAQKPILLHRVDVSGRTAIKTN